MDELETIRSLHHEARPDPFSPPYFDSPLTGLGMCFGCGKKWPCDTAQWVSEADRRAVEAGRLRRAAENLDRAMGAALESAKRENGGAGLIWADEAARWHKTLLAALEGET